MPSTTAEVKATNMFLRTELLERLGQVPRTDDCLDRIMERLDRADGNRHALCPFSDSLCSGRKCACSVRVCSGWVCAFAGAGDSRRLVDVDVYKMARALADRFYILDQQEYSRILFDIAHLLDGGVLYG